MEPSGAGVAVVENVGATASLGEVVAGAVKEASWEEDPAAPLQRHCDLRARAGAVDLDVDLALRRVDRRLVGMNGVVLAAGDDVEAAVLQVGIVEGDPGGAEGGRVALKVVRQLGRLLRVPSRPYDQRWYN
jgi:hypothetical protein